MRALQRLSNRLRPFRAELLALFPALYFARPALLRSPLGAVLFISLAALGMQQWRKQYQLQQARRRLEEAMKAHRTFQNLMATAFHKFSQPLTVVNGSLEMAVSQRRPEQCLDALEDALEQTQRLAEWTRSLAELASDESPGHLSQHVSLPLLLEEIMESAQPLASHRGLDVKLTCADRLYVSGNPLRLSQAVWNVMDNAIYYSPGGSSVKVTLSRFEAKACICIAHQRHGFEPHQIQDLFEPVFREPDTAEGAGGGGFRLAVAKRIIEAHHGSIHVESTAGFAARFQILLPLQPVPSENHRAVAMPQFLPSLRKF